MFQVFIGLFAHRRLLFAARFSLFFAGIDIIYERILNAVFILLSCSHLRVASKQMPGLKTVQVGTLAAVAIQGQGERLFYRLSRFVLGGFPQIHVFGRFDEQRVNVCVAGALPEEGFNR